MVFIGQGNRKPPKQVDMGNSGLDNLIDKERMIHIDTLPLHGKFGDVFLMDDVPEAERKAVAREVADKILARLRQEMEPLKSEG